MLTTTFVLLGGSAAEFALAAPRRYALSRRRGALAASGGEYVATRDDVYVAVWPVPLTVDRGRTSPGR